MIVIWRNIFAAVVCMAGISTANAIDCFRNIRQEADNRLQTKPQFQAHAQQFQQQQQQQQQINEAYCSTISSRLCVTFHNDINNNNSNDNNSNDNNINNNNNNNNNIISIVASNCPNSINDNCHRIYTYQRQRPLSLCSLIIISALLALLHTPHNSRANATEDATFKSSQHTNAAYQTSSASSVTLSMQLLHSKPSSQEQQEHKQQQEHEQEQQNQQQNEHQYFNNSIEQNGRLGTQQSKRYANHSQLPANQHNISLIAEWQNPCGGAFESHYHNANAFNAHYPNPPARHYLKQLRQTIGFEYRILNRTLNEIDINDMASWRLHHHRYKFLPTLKNNSKIALKRWYRNMQIFVAAFAYLGRIQYRWDSSKLLHTGRTYHELNELLISARRLLCEIETAINGSYLLNRQQKLIVIAREDMSHRLKFYTAHYTQQDIPYEVSMIDMKFAKATYYDYLLSMWKILRRQMKQRMQILKANELHNRLMYNSIDISIADDGIDMNLNVKLNAIVNSESSLSASNSDSVSVEMML